MEEKSMKGKIAFCFLLVLAVLLPSACTKKTDEAGSVDGARAEGAASEAADFGYMLRVGTWLYTIANDTGMETDTTTAIEALSLGEKLELITTEERKATNSYDSAVYDYYHVRRDTGTEGYVFATQLSVSSTLAVVTDEKANLYRGPRNVDVSDYILSRKTVFGVVPETESDGFIRVEAYDPERSAYRRNLYIRTSAISYRDADIKSSVLLQSAQTLNPQREANRYEALLNAAFQDYPDSVFADEIRTLAAGPAIPVSAVNVSLRVTDDNVNVREKPNASAATVTQLANNTVVQVVEMTVDTFSVGNQTAQWFHITQPADGWVFGAWLETEGAAD
jgi:uncharacterized protein YgiM (DUF1202 family)